MTLRRGRTLPLVLVHTGVLVLAALYLSQTLWVGTTDDDVARASFRFIAAADHRTAADVYRHLTATLARERGGWFPFADAIVVFWLSNASAAAARVVQFGLVLADVAVLDVLAWRLLRSSSGGILAVLFLLTTLVLHKHHDAVLGRVLEQPTVVLLLLLALVAWSVALDAAKPVAWTCAALALDACAVLFLPVAYLAGGAFVLAAFAQRASMRRRAASLAFVALPLVLVLGAAAAREPSAFARTGRAVIDGTYVPRVAAQAAAALPFVYRSDADIAGSGMAPSSASPTRDTRFWIVPPPRAIGWLVVVGAALLGALAVRAASGRQPWPRAVAVGLALWLLPACGPWPADMWPGGVPFPAAFPSIYLEGFGVALAAAAAVSACAAAPAARPLVLVGVPLLIAVTLLGNTRTNLRVVDWTINAASVRTLLPRASAAGLFHDLPDGTRIAADGTAGYALGPGFRNMRYALFGVSGRRYDVVPVRVLEGTQTPRRPTWIYEASAGSAFSTLVHWAGSRDREILADRGRRYSDPVDARSRRIDRKYFFASARGVERRTREVGSAVFSDVARLCGPVDRRAVFLESTPQLVYRAGFVPASRFGPPDDLRETFATPLAREPDPRFAGRTATLIVKPDACPPAPMTLLARLFTPNLADVRVRGPFPPLDLRTNASRGAALVLWLPAQRAPIAIRLTATNPPAPVAWLAPRTDNVAPFPVHVLVTRATVKYDRR